MNGGYKRCARCGAEKPLGEFYSDPTHTDGLQSRCKACRLETNKARYQQDPNYRLRVLLAQKKAYRSDPDFRRRVIEASVAWRREHPERAREAARKSQRKHQKKRTARQRERRHETANAYDARWRIDNRRTIQARARKYIQELRSWYTRRCLIARSHLVPGVLPLGLIEAHAANLKLKRQCLSPKI